MLFQTTLVASSFPLLGALAASSGEPLSLLRNLPVLGHSASGWLKWLSVAAKISPSTSFMPCCHSQTLPTRSAMPLKSPLWRQLVGPVPVHVSSDWSASRPCSQLASCALPSAVLPCGCKPLAWHHRATAAHSCIVIRCQ